MSRVKLKPINEQVIVITGASSGIGLAAARLAIERGAKVVLVARSKQTIDALAAQLNRSGTRAISVPCDVSQRSEMHRVVRVALDQFGRIDTWVNDAGLSIYGRIEEVSKEDSKRLFDVNFWGVYHGALAVLPFLRRTGGALINVGSEVPEAVVPLQGTAGQIYGSGGHKYSR
jgi:NADP-dependent 3-hydroxy acid dehydrogenase YdfG